ncbi:hypothetical protein GDO81_024364 [Engystomops pustulosus]|uniref:Uncharacterized protein n=1 Tax=Engystomops pustulosus TaxID=76066 RepID=A0AAV6YU49_ENGPU|nr:hypothetical protein GDO81_024364 [Engystomops pustulosus]
MQEGRNLPYCILKGSEEPDKHERRSCEKIGQAPKPGANHIILKRWFTLIFHSHVGILSASRTYTLCNRCSSVLLQWRSISGCSG